MEFLCRFNMEKKLNNNEKNLLLQDLCARLPYGVKCQIEEFGENFFTLKNINIDDENGHLLIFEEKINDLPVEVYLSEVKPCLRPLSSMTEEQSKELEEIDPEFYSLISSNGEIYVSMDIRGYDWLNKNNFDYRGLIPKGIAIDATGKNIY